MKRFAAATHYPFMKPLARMLVVLLVLTAVPIEANALVTIGYSIYARCGRISMRDRNPLNPNGRVILTPRNGGIFVLFRIAPIINDETRPFTFRPERLYMPAGNEAVNVATNLGDPPQPPLIVTVPARQTTPRAGWVAMEYSNSGYRRDVLLRTLGGLNASNSLRNRRLPRDPLILMAAAATQSVVIREQCTDADLLSRATRLY